MNHDFTLAYLMLRLATGFDMLLHGGVRLAGHPFQQPQPAPGAAKIGAEARRERETLPWPESATPEYR